MSPEKKLAYSFFQLKLSKEEKYFTVNNSKLIEQWRNLLREIKSQDLRSSVQLLNDSFSRAMAKKSIQVKLLLQVRTTERASSVYPAKTS